MIFSPISQAILDGDVELVLDGVNSLLADNVSPLNILDEHIVTAMNEAGKRFEEGEFFVPDLMLAARAVQETMKVIDPLLKNLGREKAGRVVIGTVRGDHHDIGKNLVAVMLEGGGFEVLDLGVNVSPEQFISAAQERRGTIVALSALLTTTMHEMKNVIEMLKELGIRNDVKVIVGGAPITNEFAQGIGADGYSDNASAAVTLARNIVSNNKL
ncbi:MAG: corrinoid protein [Planctomycetaceae bacterium]|jgi:corrinoid protein of di/trimethylamine methyltransferase|nr:corrinoid protein [Planctomycetaceae bacterium]